MSTKHNINAGCLQFITIIAAFCALFAFVKNPDLGASFMTYLLVFGILFAIACQTRIIR
jgi:cell division protein FtsW (lipid II flippase)